MTAETRRTLSVGLALLALTASACGLPQPKPDLTVSKLAAPYEETQQVLDRYLEVRGTALDLLDADALGTVESGPVLAVDAGAVTVARQLADDPDSVVDPVEAIARDQDLKVEDVLAPRLSAYPLWFVAIAEDEARRRTKVQIFQRASSVDQWELVASPETFSTTELPRFATDDDGALLPIEPDDQKGTDLSPQEAVDAYAATLDDPTSPSADLVEADSFVQQMRAGAQQASSIEGVTFSQEWGARPAEFALRTEDGGAVVFATLLRQDDYRLRKGTAVDWPDGSAQKAFLSDEIYTAGQLRYYHQVLMYVPPAGNGKPRVLGQYGGVVSGTGY